MEQDLPGKVQKQEEEWDAAERIAEEQKLRYPVQDRAEAEKPAVAAARVRVRVRVLSEIRNK